MASGLGRRASQAELVTSFKPSFRDATSLLAAG
jgi:hypothetical protein